MDPHCFYTYQGRFGCQNFCRKIYSLATLTHMLSFQGHCSSSWQHGQLILGQELVDLPVNLYSCSPICQVIAAGCQSGRLRSSRPRNGHSQWHLRQQLLPLPALRYGTGRTSPKEVVECQHSNDSRKSFCKLCWH